MVVCPPPFTFWTEINPRPGVPGSSSFDIFWLNVRKYMHTNKQTDRQTDGKRRHNAPRKYNNYRHIFTLFGPFPRTRICNSFRINRGSQFKTLDFHLVDLGSLPGGNHVSHCRWLQERASGQSCSRAPEVPFRKASDS